jgi:hypothetical protein
MSVLAPPFFANRSMVVAQLKEVACYGEGARNFGEVTDIGDVGASCELLRVSEMV